MTKILIDEDTVHNWHVNCVQKRWSGFLSEEERAAVQAAWRRHHAQGTSARDEAQALNIRFGWY